MLEVNKVCCRINAFGLQFWSMDQNDIQGYEVPAGSGIKSIFSQSLWIGGLDEAGDLCMAAERYRQRGADFFSGPVMDSTAYSNDQNIQWHKVWKLTSQEIHYHTQHWKECCYQPVENIARWPGDGDTTLGQARHLALYYDLDGDGRYDPMKGDCPMIKGDEAILVINNDDRGPHKESGGKKLGVEIQTLYYAYEADHDSALKYTTFADQYIINRSSKAYHDVYVGHFLDFDLGYFLDDYLASDTNLESAICYNGILVDGQGNPGEYGEHPPAQSFTCLNYHMGGFVYFMSFGGPAYMQDPLSDGDYYNYLRGYWKDSTPFTYGGNGYGGEVPVNCVFTGDPVSGTGWTEFDSPLGPGDRRGLVSSGPYSLIPGDTIHLEYAFVFARDPEGTNLTSLGLLQERILQVREFYLNSPGINDIGTDETKINIYPNPCRDHLFIDWESRHLNPSAEYFVYDITGKVVKYGSLYDNDFGRIDVRDLSPGFYVIRLLDGRMSISRKFIKGD